MALPDDCKEGDYILHREEHGYWMAEAPCYYDSAASPVGYGKTHEEAVEDLIRQPQFQEFLKRSREKAPSLSHFKIDDRPASVLCGAQGALALIGIVNRIANFG